MNPRPRRLLFLIEQERCSCSDFVSGGPDQRLRLDREQFGDVDLTFRPSTLPIMPRFNPYLNGLGDMNIPDLVRLIRQASDGIETIELEWKLRWDLDSRPRRAELARHLIGFANRDPDQAQRVFGGHAFLLIGVEPGRLGQAPQLDPADIDQRLSPYTGTELSWHPVYVQIEETRVLVLVVDPPEWGDPVFRLERASADPATGRELRAGTVFVRRPGTTLPANEADLERLRARANVPRPRLTVAVNWNLGRSGNYIEVTVGNGVAGHRAITREVGFTLAGTVETAQIEGLDHHEAEPEKALAYASLPISQEDCIIEPGEVRRFRVPLGRAPFFWDEEIKLYPYVYYDDHRWLVGESSPLGYLLSSHGWTSDETEDPMFRDMRLNYVWPPSVEGLKASFDLTRALPQGAI